MAVTVKLYGDLRENVKREGFERGLPSTLNIKNNKMDTVFDILEKLKINQSEISHIFVNGKYCSPGKRIREGDRIGLFPKRMALMFVTLNPPCMMKLRDRVWESMILSWLPAC